MMNEQQIDRKYLIVVETNPVEKEKHFIYKSKITDEEIIIAHPRIKQKLDDLDINVKYRDNHTVVIYSWKD